MKLTPAVNFINVFFLLFLYKRLFSSCVLALEAKFHMKNARLNIDEIDTWGQFHQCSTYSFYAHRSQKRKKILMTWLSSYAFGISTSAKAVRKTLMKLTPGGHCHVGRCVKEENDRLTTVWSRDFGRTAANFINILQCCKKLDRFTIVFKTDLTVCLAI